MRPVVRSGSRGPILPHYSHHVRRGNLLRMDGQRPVCIEANLSAGLLFREVRLEAILAGDVHCGVRCVP